MDGLKKRIEEEGGAWVDQLDHILWAHRTTPRRGTGETPFSLTYGFEAKVPIEVLCPTSRVQQYEDPVNEQLLQLEKNFLEERRDAPQHRMTEYQRAVKRYHDAHVEPRYFDIGDIVLTDRQAALPNQGGKIAKNWEGPYRDSTIIRPGTYKLETMEGKLIERIWNSNRLKRDRETFSIATGGWAYCQRTGDVLNKPLVEHHTDRERKMLSKVEQGGQKVDELKLKSAYTEQSDQCTNYPVYINKIKRPRHQLSGVHAK
ncbi:PREDICTED: uncharacterized protein LOC109169440 [Ipomoea nil]|uniref:uncharacterized protein LOC109169440 n=1 Tax=Ipomoea nil TaxID=35883 RepID=UPI0009014A63|nr:PREDICTED: uncharacterized protein LOC109169440 [Ipomoea nil]